MADITTLGRLSTRMAHPSQLRGPRVLTFGGTPLLEGAELSRRRRRARVPGRPQRLGQVDAAQDRGGADRGRTAASASCSRARPMRYLPQEPDLAGYATHARLRRGRARPDRRSASGALSAGSSWARAARRTRRACRAARLRRAALAHVLAPGARHPAARRADQPSRPAGHRMARSATRRAARRAGAHQPRPALPAKRCRARPSGSTAARRGASSIGFRGFEAWRDRASWPRRSCAQHKLDRKIVREEHWVRYGVTARRKRNVRRVGELQALRESPPRPIAAPPARRRSRRRGRCLRASWWSRPRASARPSAAGRSCADFSHRASCAATASASSAQRQRQDHAGQSAHRRARARRAAPSRLGANLRDGRRSTSAARASIRTGPLSEALTGGRGDTVDGRRPDASTSSAT